MDDLWTRNKTQSSKFLVFIIIMIMMNNINGASNASFNIHLRTSSVVLIQNKIKTSHFQEQIGAQITTCFPWGLLLIVSPKFSTVILFWKSTMGKVQRLENSTLIPMELDPPWTVFPEHEALRSSEKCVIMYETTMYDITRDFNLLYEILLHHSSNFHSCNETTVITG